MRELLKNLRISVENLDFRMNNFRQIEHTFQFDYKLITRFENELEYLLNFY